MDKVLAGTDSFAAAYLDDVVVFSNSWEEHLSHLQTVLHKIEEAGLIIHPDKCSVAKQKSQYLGFVLGKGVIRPQVGKVEAVKLAERPQTKSQVKSFMGLVGWYSRFIPCLSTISAPFTNLTKKNLPNKVLWTEDCEETFQRLKDTLCKEPVLRSPDFEQSFTVQTDASEVGIGAVLL